jgi:hypothetical protein
VAQPRGLSLQTKVLDLKERVRGRGCGKKGRAVVAIKVAPAERLSRPLLPAPVKGQRSRHSGEGAAPGCGGAAVEQAGGTEDERAGANRGDTKRVEAHGRRTSRHPGPALPGGAATEDRQIAGRRIGGTVPGDDSQAAGEGDRTSNSCNREGAIDNIGAGHASKWKLAGA